MIRSFRCVATSPDLLTHDCARSPVRLRRALRSGRLNQPKHLLGKEPVAAEAGVALAAVRVQDPEGRAATRWAGPAAGDHHLRSLADHVPAQPDPRPTGQLEPDAGRLADRTGEPARARHVRRLEHDEADPGPSGQRRQPAESIGESAPEDRVRAFPIACRQVDDQQVDGATGEQRAGDRQTLVRVGRGQDDEPLRLDPPGDDLDGVERGGEVQPGDDRAGGLRRRGESQRERGPPARQVAAQCHAHASRHAAGTEDGIELGEAGREDSIPVRLWQRTIRFERDRGQRADDVAREPGRGRAPTRSKGRQGRAEVRIRSGHRTPSIEQMFE